MEKGKSRVYIPDNKIKDAISIGKGIHEGYVPKRIRHILFLYIIVLCHYSIDG